jgi:hypothetical protein
MLLYEVIYGARAHTAATVVSSLVTMNVEGVKFPQAPSAVIIDKVGLFVPGASPGLPPVATRYTSDEAEGQLY